MHVGVLIKAKNKQEALTNLEDEIHCFQSEFDSNGEEVPDSLIGDWDYSYGKLNEFWWNGENEDSKVLSETSSEDFLEWLNGKGKDFIDNLFEYYLNEKNEVIPFPDKKLFQEEFSNIQDYKVYVACVHV